MIITICDRIATDFKYTVRPDGYNTGEAYAQMYDEEFVEAGN